VAKPIYKSIEPTASDNDFELESSVLETDNTSLGEANTIPPGMRLSYCYFDQNSKLVFRKKHVLVPLAPETDKTNSRGVSTIPPTSTYTLNSVCTSQTNDGTTMLQASLPHAMVLSSFPKLSDIVPMPKVSCDASLTDLRKFINRFFKSTEAKLDMQAMHDWRCLSFTLQRDTSHG
jgi:hypothetical protein